MLSFGPSELIVPTPPLRDEQNIAGPPEFKTADAPSRPYTRRDIHSLFTMLSFNMEELEGPGPEFIAATSIAQLAPLLFDAAEDVDKLGSEPEHVAVAEETVRAFLKRQDPDLDRSVATVSRVEDGVKIEYEERTVTITYGDE